MAAAASVVLVIMGVSGSGKSTLGMALAARLGWPFQEGDDLHSAENILKMRNGIALDDNNRAPWLQNVAAQIDRWIVQGRSGIITCSALKKSYRRSIVGDRPEVRLVYLSGPQDLIFSRVIYRQNHYMPSSLLDSQFQSLEPPNEDEQAVMLSSAEYVSFNVDKITDILGRTT